MATINRKVRDFSDFNLLFTPHPVTADVSKVLNENAIKAAVRNLVLTKNYERPFHPEIGCQITSLLFENYTPIVRATMERTIQDVLEKFEPRARLTKLDIVENVDENAVDVTIEFAINNIERPVTVTVTLTRAR
jgi:phage baseplate assembly protein W